jgi:FixJ family two-component response regulator
VASAAPIIAVVDDESSVRTMLGRLLRLADYRVSVFASGEEFLASLRAAMPACVILDIHMPGLSGLEVHAQLRAARMRIPVVFITASDDIALDRAAAEANVVRLLRKPFSSDALLEAVGDALQSGATGDLTKD